MPRILRSGSVAMSEATASGPRNRLSLLAEWVIRPEGAEMPISVIPAGRRMK